MSIEEKIKYINDELEYLEYTDEYINQWNNAINDAKHKLDFDTFSILLNTQLKILGINIDVRKRFQCKRKEKIELLDD